MKSSRMRALTAILLSSVLLFGIQGGVAHAQKPGITEYAEKEELMTQFGLAANSTECKIRFGNGKEWYIAGQDGTDTIALLSSTSFGYSPFSEAQEDNWYGDDNKDRKSKVKKFLENCETDTYFSLSELNLMKNTSVKTEDASGYHLLTVTGRLYLPCAQDRYSFDGATIYVGENNDLPILLS